MFLRYCTTTIFVLWFIGQSFTLATTAAGDLDVLLVRIQNKYAKMNTFAADFAEYYHAPNARTRSESGHLQLKKSGKMRWEYTAPESKFYLVDGQFFYEYLPAARSATKFNLKTTQDWRTPFLFLLGRGNLRRDFARIEFAPEAPVRAGHLVLRLWPKAGRELREVWLELDPQTLQLARVSFLRTDQARIDFIFSNIQENLNLPDSNFIFKTPAGITLRQQ